MQVFGKILFTTLSSNPDFIILTEEGYKQVKQYVSNINYPIGALIKVEGSEEKGVIFSNEVIEIKGKEALLLEKKLGSVLRKKCLVKKTKPLVDEEVIQKMSKLFEETAEFLMLKLLHLTPMIVRFHDDCDGVCSAELIKTALMEFAKREEIPLELLGRNFIQFKQADSAIYSLKEVEADLLDAQAWTKKPLLLMLDHGGNEESIPALNAVKEGNIPCAIIDHHPPAKKVNDYCELFCSPFAVGGGSEANAGLICYEVANSISGKAEERLAYYSMQTDKSPFALKKEFPEAIAIDYLAVKAETLEEYEEIIYNQFKAMLLYRKAISAIQEATKQAVKELKIVNCGNGVIALTNLGKFTKKGSFPSKGKLLNEIHFKQGEANAVVSIGYDSNTIMFRVNSKAHEKGFKANELIEELKKEGIIESGGGHERASSLKCKPELLKQCLERTLELAERKLS